MRGYFDDEKNFNKYAPGVSTCPGWDQENAGSLPDPSDRPSSVAAKCDTYVRPSSRGYDRDRVHVIGTAAGSHCATAARSLLKIGPCINLLGIITNPLCTSLSLSLQSCECKVAANAMLQLPCLDLLGLSCKPTVTELNACVK
jgi:hypothetical protein